ncbi:hypothetical protein F5Y12DRAFT_793977 [Xylaria sp. FL1777]|nr:hypothetical protein F5Y12DRAFT_793977 [Xylaria sp. FL1777]
MHSHQTSQFLTPTPQNPLLQNPVVQMALHILTQLQPRLTQPYIDPGDWNKFRITCGQLDVSWKSEKGGAFLQLITPEKMQQIASQYEFDQLRELRPDPSYPFNNSDVVATHLCHHFRCIYQDEYLICRSKWENRLPDDWEADKLRYFSPGEEFWQVKYVLSVRDGHLPHMGGVLLEVGQLKENTLLFSEVWSILMLTLLRYHTSGNEKIQVVPVTLVTISGTTFRIVQGFVDSKAGRVRIHKSGIMQVGPDKKTVKERMMLMVRWMLAEPVWPSKQ